MRHIPATSRRLGWVVALTSIAYFMVVLDSVVVITALPRIQRDLHAGLSSLQWTVNAYGISFAAGIVTAAALGDRFGRRRIFNCGLALFTVASAVCALAPNVGELIAARTVQGVGAAAVLPLSLTILTTAFPAERRGTIVGIYGGLAGLAVALGPIVSGAITEAAGWHWIFWINVPFGLGAVLSGQRLLPESHGAPARLDLAGVVLVTGGVVALVWALTRAGEAGWGSPAIVGGLVTGCLLLATLLPFFATPMLVSPVAGALSDRIGRRPIIVVGLSMLSAGFVWVAWRGSLQAGWLELVTALLVAGVGISMALPTAPTAVLNAVATHEMGKASGINYMAQRLGAVFGVAIGSAVFGAYGSLTSPATVTAGFRPALAACAGFALVAVLGGVAMRANGSEPAAQIAPPEVPVTVA
ncbi:MAG: MFS transporter [Solirubrobacteraceae bacterium]